MDETQFWAMIEAAWQAVGGKTEGRRKLAAERLSQNKAEKLMEALEDVIPALREQLGLLSVGDLSAFDRILD